VECNQLNLNATNLDSILGSKQIVRISGGGWT
jgi:hypothetical protein